MEDWNIKLVNILPRFVSGFHDVRFDIFKGAPFLELKHSVFGGIAQATAYACKQRQAGWTEKDTRRKHGETI